MYVISTDVHGAELIDFRRLFQRQQHYVQQFPRVRHHTADGHELDRVRGRQVRQQIRVRGPGVRPAVHTIRVHRHFLQLQRQRQTHVSSSQVPPRSSGVFTGGRGPWSRPPSEVKKKLKFTSELKCIV